MLHGGVQTAHSAVGLHLDAELPHCSAQTKKKALAAAKERRWQSSASCCERLTRIVTANVWTQI